MALLRHPHLFALINKTKLWPSNRGILHGIRVVENLGVLIRMSTYCGKVIIVRSSKRGRAARWLRNRWMRTPCQACGVPEWKIERFKKSV